MFRYAERRSEIEASDGLNIFARMIVKCILPRWGLIDGKDFKAFPVIPQAPVGPFMRDCASSIRWLRDA
jgi:hypothetical protein